MVTSDEVEQFWNDGVVCLRGVIPVELIEAMACPVEQALSGEEAVDMAALSDSLEGADPGATTGFRSGVDHWRTRPAFRAFAADSPVPQLIGGLLRATSVRLYEDSVLVKEPGTPHRTAWHQDLSYFNLSGSQLATTWIPLDVATTESGAMRFVRGSHRWGEVYQPNLFVSDMVIPGTSGRPVPDLDTEASDDIISFDLGPGDLTVHHALTLHAAGGNTSDRRRRALSIRYCGPDARFERREGTILKPYQRDLKTGDALSEVDCPTVWRAEPPSARRDG